MTPAQLHQTARLLQEHCPPPRRTQDPQDYFVSETVYRLASAIGQIAQEMPIEEQGAEEPQVGQPAPDEEHLRHVALDFALRGQRSAEGGRATVDRADIFLTFLRGTPTTRTAQEEAAWAANGK